MIDRRHGIVGRDAGERDVRLERVRAYPLAHRLDVRADSRHDETRQRCLRGDRAVAGVHTHLSGHDRRDGIHHVQCALPAIDPAMIQEHRPCSVDERTRLPACTRMEAFDIHRARDDRETVYRHAVIVNYFASERS